MNAQAAVNVAEDTTEAKPTAPGAGFHEAAIQRWTSKVASLGEDMAKAQARLDALEVEAAQAALDGKPMPTAMGQVEAELRALKRARQMAQEEIGKAEEALTQLRRDEAREAAAAVAAQLEAEAAALDDTLAEVGHRLTVLSRLGQQYDRLASTAVLRRRRGALAISPTAVAGAVMAAAPELLEILGSPRPSHDARRPLAVAMARRHGPQLVKTEESTK